MLVFLLVWLSLFLCFAGSKGEENSNPSFLFRPLAILSFISLKTDTSLYDPTQPLKWSDLESVPFCEITQVTLLNQSYKMTCPFPKNKKGRHLISNIWQRPDRPFCAKTSSQFLMRYPSYYDLNEKNSSTFTLTHTPLFSFVEAV